MLPSIYSRFRKVPGHRSVLPCFLQGLTKLVFDSSSGVVLGEADPTAVFYIRQICNFFKKVRATCTRARERATILNFVATDQNLPTRIELGGVSRSVAYTVVSSLNFADSHEQCLPKHGPGATFEKTWGNQKYLCREFYARWKGVFDPVDLYGSSVLRTKDVTIVEEEREKPCRLSLVPKTQKAPRTIAVEPTAMQYAQQYISARLIGSMKESKFTKHIDFADQSVNRRLAKIGSLTGQWATIDLSEASDRVSIPLVEELFGSDSILLSSLMAVRSRSIRLPNGEDILLRKYSTSGSAVTFPVETIVFFMLALSAIVEAELHTSDVASLISKWAQSVSVYGDDIVVPAQFCSTVISHLESFGLKVNRNKTFSRGSFRESCGGDYFKGHDVTPKYLRTQLDDDGAGRQSIPSWVSTGNQLFFAGCWKTSNWIRNWVDSLFPVPLTKRTCPGAGWHSHRDVYEFTKILPDFGIRVRTMVTKTKPIDNTIDSYFALLKHWLSADVQEDAVHLLQSIPRFRGVVSVKWTTPY